MDPDFTALASRVAARAEVLGCVILSRDGLVLGSFPPNGEMDITPGLLRFAALGDPDRGFAQFADELWAYVREGSYAAFAVAEAGTRPGILLDYLEQALLVAGEFRQSAAAMSEPMDVDLSMKGIGLGRRLRAATPSPEDDFRASVAAPARTAETGAPPEPPMEPPPHREVPAVDDRVLDEALAAAAAAHEPEPDPVRDEPVAAFELDPVEAGAPAPQAFHEEPAPFHEEPAPFHEEPPAMESPPRAPVEPPPPAPPEPGPEPEPEPEPEPRLEEPPASGQRPEEIDRIALAREFAQLLQEGPGGAEGGQ
jgi:hypothetical protein